jgi:hypothetical protein
MVVTMNYNKKIYNFFESRWEDGIRMDLREIGLGCVDSTGSG